ncbi:hypothetical protein KKA17_07700 [bacterium]|nr:hypothetical protein [bacterium]MBU1883274.1 hypothetical protein [bacterium]
MLHQVYTRNYIWNRFKYSLLTLAGVLLPSLSSLMMMFADWPASLQLLNVSAFFGIVGISYWWHWFFSVEELAQEGVKEYMKIEDEQRSRELYTTLGNLDLTPYPPYQALKMDLGERYVAFINAIKKQKIISDSLRSNFTSKARQAFDSGIELLAEINDILIVQSSVNIASIQEQYMQDSDKKHLEQIIQAYNDNEAKLAKLEQSLHSLNHSFVFATSNLATLTSKTHEKEDFETLELQEAIDAAKVIKEKLNTLSKAQNSELENIYAKYTPQLKENIHG